MLLAGVYARKKDESGRLKCSIIDAFTKSTISRYSWADMVTTMACALWLGIISTIGMVFPLVV